MILDLPHLGRSHPSMRFLKVHRRGPYKIVTVSGHDVVLADMESKVLPDIYSIRRLIKIDNYLENFPIDKVKTNAETIATVFVTPTSKTKTSRGIDLTLCKPIDGLETDYKPFSMWLPNNALKSAEVL